MTHAFMRSKDNDKCISVIRMSYTVNRSVVKSLEPGLPNDNLIMIVKYE